MENFNQFEGKGLYPYMERYGAGTPSSRDVLTDDNTDFDSVNFSFVYAIVPGKDGVKFEVMEEDGLRIAGEMLEYTFQPNQVITGRFNRLRIDEGDCVIYIARSPNFYFATPKLGEITGDFVAGVASALKVPVIVPGLYNLFNGEDLAFLIKIHRTDLAAEDYAIGLIHLKEGDNNALQLTAYGHADTEETATIADGVATHYIAYDKDVLDADALDAFIDDDADTLNIALTLNETGSYVFEIYLVEMLVDGVLKVAGHILDQSLKEIIVAEPEADTDTDTDADADTDTDGDVTPPDVDVDADGDVTPPDVDVDTDGDVAPPEPDVDTDGDVTPPEPDVDTDGDVTPPEPDVDTDGDVTPPDVDVDVDGDIDEGYSGEVLTVLDATVVFDITHPESPLNPSSVNDGLITVKTGTTAGELLAAVELADGHPDLLPLTVRLGGGVVAEPGDVLSNGNFLFTQTDEFTYQVKYTITLADPDTDVDTDGDVAPPEPDVDTDGDVTPPEPDVDVDGDQANPEPDVDTDGDVAPPEPDVDTDGDVTPP